MAVPTLPGTNVTKLDQTDDFKQIITDAVNALVKTEAGSTGGSAIGQNPFLTNVPGSGSLSSTNYGGVPPILSGQIVTTSPLPTDLVTSNVVASGVVTLFQNTAQILSRARRYTMQKQYNNFGTPINQVLLGFPTTLVAVNQPGNIFTISGNQTPNFAAGTTFTISGNTLPAANKSYTITNRVPNGGNTDVTVSPGTIPVGTTATGIARPDRYIHATSNYQIIQTVAATTGNITLSGLQVIDGVSVVAGNLVLVKNQAAPAQNGVYVAAAGAWSRSTLFDDLTEVIQGVIINVNGGTTNQNTYWQLTTGGVITIGVTALTFTLFNTVTLTGNISAGGLNALVGNFNDAVAAHRDTVIPFYEIWCHSNCHSNHSSRGRR